MLRAADITVLPEEPIKVPKSAVRRDRITIEATHVFEAARDSNAEAEGSASLGVSKEGIAGSLGGKVAAKRATGEAERFTRKTISHSGMTIEHSVDEEQRNRWSFSPLQGATLRGQAFNTTEPLLKLRHSAEIPKIAPVVKVRVTCLREHIEIIDLEVKEEERGFLNRGMGAEKKLKLAEELIKDALVSNGLHFEGELDKNSLVVVADVIATEE
jgi:hypothetical protein